MAASKSIPEVRLANAMMTSKSRLYPTKEGKWLKNDIEKKSAAELTSTFTAASAESRNRPYYGLQELCHTLLLAVPHLRDGVAKGIYGPAVAKLVEDIQSHQSALQQLNGAEKNVVRSRPSVKAAVDEVLDWLVRLSQKKTVRDMLPFLFVKSEIGKHVSNQLLEWTSAMLDPAALAAAATMPESQPAPMKLRKVSTKDTLPGAVTAFKAYFTEVLAPTAPAAAAVDDTAAGDGEATFANWADSPVAPKRKSRKRQRVEEEEADEAAEADA